MPPTLSISVWNELLGAEQAMEEGTLQPPMDLALISVHFCHHSSCDSLPWEHLSHGMWGWDGFVSCLSAGPQFSDEFLGFACLISVDNVREEHHLFHTAVKDVMEKY